MTARATRARCRAVAVLLALVTIAAGPVGGRVGGAPGPGSARAVVDSIRAVPLTMRHRYRLGAAIRFLPLPGLWIHRRNVGHGELTYRTGGAVQAYELLAGSDPALAPRRFNRWAYVAEARDGSQSRLLGLIKQSDEQSLEDVSASLARERTERRYPFKLYAASIEAGQAATGDAVVWVDRDFAVRDLEPLLGLIGETAVQMARRERLDGHTRSGLLHALLGSLQQLVAQADDGRPDVGQRVPYFFNGTRYEVLVKGSSLVPSLRVGARTYRDVLRVSFEGSQPGTSKRVPFEIACLRTGSLRAVPVLVVVRPRWWFQFELALDEGDAPARPRAQTAATPEP